MSVHIIIDKDIKISDGINSRIDHIIRHYEKKFKLYGYFDNVKNGLLFWIYQKRDYLNNLEKKERVNIILLNARWKSIDFFRIIKELDFRQENQTDSNRYYPHDRLPTEEKLFDYSKYNLQERQVLNKLDEGYNQKEIAEQMCISKSRVSQIVRQIRKKIKKMEDICIRRT